MIEIFALLLALLMLILVTGIVGFIVIGLGLILAAAVLTWFDDYWNIR